MAKKVIQRMLPLDVKYRLIEVTYLSIEDGGGCSCDNCGKLITNIAHIQNDQGKNYAIGLDCLDTILENNNLLEHESYVQYVFSDKPAIQKAKQLRSKCLKMAKQDENWKAIYKEFEDSFGFSFETTRNGMFEPLGWNYTYQLKYKELTLNYLKGLKNVVIHNSSN